MQGESVEPSPCGVLQDENPVFAFEKRTERKIFSLRFPFSLAVSGYNGTEWAHLSSLSVFHHEARQAFPRLSGLLCLSRPVAVSSSAPPF